MSNKREPLSTGAEIMNLKKRRKLKHKVEGEHWGRKWSNMFPGGRPHHVTLPPFWSSHPLRSIN